MARFENGNPGRKPGSRNKTTAAVKAALLRALQAGEEDGGEQEGADGSAKIESRREPSLINDVRTFRDRKIGKLLESRDGRASLVIVELTTEFLNRENRKTIEAIEGLIRNEVGQPAGTIWSRDLPAWEQAGLNPRDIQMRLGGATSGEATVGRDMLRASDDSADATEFWTVVLVVILLVVVPLLQTTREGDLLCDPFHGSGTVGDVAQVYGRRYVGYDVKTY